MDTLTQTLITPPKEAKLDSSESQTPANTMSANPNKLEKECCKCKQSTLCCMFVFGLSIFTVSATCH